MFTKKAELDHDLDGKVFNYLEVTRPLDEKNERKTYLYECRCLICGSLTKATRSELKRGNRKTCGSISCRTTARQRERKKEFTHPGFPDCNGYASEHACSILKEMVCRKKGKCKFYKSKYDD